MCISFEKEKQRCVVCFDVEVRKDMKLKDILRAVTVLSHSADLETEVTDITNDSRAVESGCLFVAVKGLTTDGHKYIPMAMDKGAAAVICQDIPEGDVPYVQVADSRKALAMGATTFFGNPSSQMKVIGVTGTNGKTTTTSLIKHVLEQAVGAKVGMIGTNGNWVGDVMLPSTHTTPESRDLQALFAKMLAAGCTHVVMEVSSHALHQGRVDGTDFDVGVFTNLTQDHLDYHVTMEHYAEAKAGLFRRCKFGGVNADDPWAETMMDGAACPILTYAVNSEADLVAENPVFRADGVSFDAVYGGERHPVRLAVPGTFSVYNALTVLAAALQLGIGLEAACEALSTAKGVKGRVEVVPTDGNYTILIDYAHTPDALDNVLDSMRKVTDGRLVVLFGCGGDRDRTKRPIMGRIAQSNADLVIVTSDNPRTEDPMEIIDEILTGMHKGLGPVQVIENRPRAIEWAIENHEEGDVIILAGKGHEDYQIIGTTKYHMDEREIVAEVLNKRRERK